MISLRHVSLLVVWLALTPAVAGEGQTLGKAPSGADTVQIPELLAHPDAYVGKTVRVEGVVTGVCAMAGCWMTLAPEPGGPDLRIKVQDGVIVFPMEAKGKRAIAEGEFTRIAMTLEQTIAWKRHEAEELKRPFDAAQVTEAMTVYEIRATGAVIR
jgi:hypothetical protein